MLPTAADYLNIHRVDAICQTCQHVAQIDLAAVVAAGQGDVPLVKLRLRCTGCGGVDCRVVVSGRRFVG